MEINEAQRKVDELIQKYGGYWEPLSMLARLVEEVGELSRAMNIEYGGKRKKKDDDGRAIGKELSDVIFTTLAIAQKTGVDLNTELAKKIEQDFEKCKGVYDK